MSWQNDPAYPGPTAPHETWTPSDAPGLGSAMPPPVPPPGAPWGTAAGQPGSAMHELRPLSTGEILDRTFALYKSRFWLFAGISSLAAVVQVVAAGAQMIGFRGMIPVRMPTPGASPSQLSGVLAHSSEAILISYGVGLIYFLAISITQAASAWALSEVYLGRGTTVGEALRLALRRWGAWILIALWQAWSLLWLPLLLGVLAAGISAVLATRRVGGALWAIPVLLIFAVFGGFVFGVIRYLMNSLALPAGAIENLPVRAAMRRSKALSQGTKGRIFLVLLVVWALFLVAGMLQAPLSILWLRAPAESHVIAQATMLLIGFVAHTVVTPVMMIGLTLVYFDQRVRREAFDLMMLMGEGPAGMPPAAAGLGDATIG